IIRHEADSLQAEAQLALLEARTERVAEILEIASDAIGMKAKTGEGVGPIGREEAISAQCVVLLEPANSNLSTE
ncbi:MAG: 2-C-methyl-D-erythritol 2,4-cyclodiphosphate synthase, partial [Planctomycetes bacterium]|nr:2-C-methyl-D-erythritol 2,4-cyclodiphosphate synthase [Planctomycetota bacterium]